MKKRLILACVKHIIEFPEHLEKGLDHVSSSPEPCDLIQFLPHSSPAALPFRDHAQNSYVFPTDQPLQEAHTCLGLVVECFLHGPCLPGILSCSPLRVLLVTHVQSELDSPMVTLSATAWFQIQVPLHINIKIICTHSALKCKLHESWEFLKSID